MRPLPNYFGYLLNITMMTTTMIFSVFVNVIVFQCVTGRSRTQRQSGWSDAMNYRASTTTTSSSRLQDAEMMMPARLAPFSGVVMSTRALC